MNYKIFRIIVWTVIWIIMVFAGGLILTKKSQWSKKTQIILVIISTIIATITFTLPLGSNKRFKTLEDAFKYYFPKSTILQTYNGKSHAFVYLETQKNKNSREFDFVYFIKDKRGWNLGKTDDLHYGREKTSIQEDRSFIIVNRIESENKTGVYILTSSSKSLIKNPIISDSVSTNFEPISNSMAHAYIGIIDGIVDDNYTIKFNNKKYQPLKK